MSENTNDLYMQWNTTLGATHTSIFLAVGLAKGVISLVHFLSKLHQDKLLKGGEVENFASFLKVTKGDYNIERVPLTVNGNAEEDIAKAGHGFRRDPLLHAAGLQRGRPREIRLHRSL